MTEERLLSQANINDTMRCKQATGIMPTVCGALHRAADQKGATPTEFQSDITACWLPEGPGLGGVWCSFLLLPRVGSTFEQMLEQLRDLLRLAEHG